MEVLAIDRPSWYDEAQCLGTTQEIFFYESRDNEQDKVVLRTIAKSICRVCTVKKECLNYALETRQVGGIWGGLTPKERKRLRKRVVA